MLHVGAAGDALSPLTPAHDGAPPAFLDHPLGIIDRSHSSQAAHVSIKNLGRRCCIAAAAYPFWRYALSLLIHHSTLVILLWDGAAYNPSVDRIDLCAPCPGSDPSALFSSAGLRRDRFFRDDRSNICALAQFWPSCDILNHHYYDLLLRQDLFGLQLLARSIVWPGAHANRSGASVSALRAVALAPTHPLTPRQRPC
ncbi:hypothetical protein LA080_004312 [Diaporthe eres]|nr:hypothetical protein LA080_004312 [Diaporthe eres]